MKEFWWVPVLILFAIVFTLLVISVQEGKPQYGESRIVSIDGLECVEQYMGNQGWIIRDCVDPDA
jgi:hypothetical protein